MEQTAMKELYASLDEALKNLEMASSSLNGMYRIGAPSSCINHMSQSVTTWQKRVATLRAEIQNALAAEGAASVAVEVVTEPTQAEKRIARSERPVTITFSELDNLINLASNEIRRREENGYALRSNAVKGETKIRRQWFDRSNVRYREILDADLAGYRAEMGIAS
jgi:hypothetical protein